MKSFILYTLLFLNFYCFSQERKEELFIDGKVKRVYFINKDGKLEGEDIYFDYAGNVKVKKYWNNGKLKDSIVKYKRSGDIHSIGYVKKDSLLFYRPNGVKESEVGLLNGNMNGSKLTYNIHGDLISAKMIRNNLEDGLAIIMHEDKIGFPEFIYEANKGKRDGILMNFYKNGRMKLLRTSDVFNDGQQILFHENGVVKEIFNTKLGKKHGWTFIFSEKGKLIKRLLYKKGNLVVK